MNRWHCQIREGICCFSLFAVILIVSQTARADIILSSFDSSLEGWASSPGGTVVFRSSGGNPGGFLEQTDIDLTDMFAIAPNKFLGDRRSFAGGFIAFDARHVGGNGELYPPFGIVTLRNGANFVSADMAPPGNPTTDWRSYRIDLDATSFGTSVSNLNAILSNLTSLEVTLESRVGSVEVTGFDNFSLTSVPEPSSATVFGLVIGSWVLRRVLRKRQVYLGNGSARMSSPCWGASGTTLG